MPCHSRCPLEPVPTGGIAVDRRLGANRTELAQLPCFAVPDVDRWTFRVQAGDQGKSRMAYQLLNRTSATDSYAGYGLNNSHPNTVVLSGSCSEVLTSVWSRRPPCSTTPAEPRPGGEEVRRASTPVVSRWTWGAAPRCRGRCHRSESDRTVERGGQAQRGSRTGAQRHGAPCGRPDRGCTCAAKAGRVPTAPVLTGVRSRASECIRFPKPGLDRSGVVALVTGDVVGRTRPA